MILVKYSYLWYFECFMQEYCISVHMYIVLYINILRQLNESLNFRQSASNVILLLRNIYWCFRASAITNGGVFCVPNIIYNTVLAHLNQKLARWEQVVVWTHSTLIHPTIITLGGQNTCPDTCFASINFLKFVQNIKSFLQCLDKYICFTLCTEDAAKSMKIILLLQAVPYKSSVWTTMYPEMKDFDHQNKSLPEGNVLTTVFTN